MWNCCSFFFRALSFLSGILHSSGHYVAGMFNIQKGGCPSISRRSTYSPGSRRNAVLLLQPARCCDRPIPIALPNTGTLFPDRCMLARFSTGGNHSPQFSPESLPTVAPAPDPKFQSLPLLCLVKNRCPCLSKVSTK